MKYTGIVRRIDSLGRIVIPKEVRNKLKIKENENMEIFIEDDKIYLKKYTVLNDFEKNIKFYGNLLHNFTNKNVLITNRENIIYANNSISDKFNGKELSDSLIDYLINRKEINISKLEIIKNIEIDSIFYGLPIIYNSDVVGLIIIFDEELDNSDKLALKIINKILTQIFN